MYLYGITTLVIQWLFDVMFDSLLNYTFMRESEGGGRDSKQ